MRCRGRVHLVLHEDGRPVFAGNTASSRRGQKAAPPRRRGAFVNTSLSRFGMQRRLRAAGAIRPPARAVAEYFVSHRRRPGTSPAMPARSSPTPTTWPRVFLVPLHRRRCDCAGRDRLHQPRASRPADAAAGSATRQTAPGCSRPSTHTRGRRYAPAPVRLIFSSRERLGRSRIVVGMRLLQVDARHVVPPYASTRLPADHLAPCPGAPGPHKDLVLLRPMGVDDELDRHRVVRRASTRRASLPAAGAARAVHAELFGAIRPGREVLLLARVRAERGDCATSSLSCAYRDPAPSRRSCARLTPRRRAADGRLANSSPTCCTGLFGTASQEVASPSRRPPQRAPSDASWCRRVPRHVLAAAAVLFVVARGPAPRRRCSFRSHVALLGQRLAQALLRQALQLAQVVHVRRPPTPSRTST